MSADRNGSAAALHLEPPLVAAGDSDATELAPHPPAVHLRPAADDDDDDTEDDGEFASLIQRQLELLGEDSARDGLRRTPDRVAAAMRWMTRGYGQDVVQVVGNGVFEDAYENMVLVRDVELFSLCEHHLLPFFGKVHVAYVPAGRILGLSKVARIVDVFARRLQVQERLTEEIADAIMQVLQPRGAGVVIEARHLCMMMRGVEKQNSSTVTSALRGSFREDMATREEFLRLAHR
jgi:GTP cyclohydrolase IA